MLAAEAQSDPDAGIHCTSAEVKTKGGGLSGNAPVA